MRDERIIGIGTDDTLNELISPETIIIDLNGKTVVPGLVDSHTHLIHYGLCATRNADLTGCTSISALQDKLRNFHNKNPHFTWLLGRGFDHEMLEERRWPTREDLDKVSKDIPIVVTRVCLHALVVNSAVINMIKSKLTREQQETGIFSDGATDVVWRTVPSPSIQEIESATEWALNDAASKGLTGVHTIVHNKAELNVLLNLGSNNRLPIRVHMICSNKILKHLLSSDIRTGWRNNHLSFGAIKLYLDGSLGARTAALLEPYSDAPDSCGALLIDENELSKHLIQLQSNGFQAAIHAIGDRAVEAAVNAIESTIPFGNTDNRFRHRIEHASMLNPNLIQKLAELRIPVSVQPQFVTSDFWTSKRIGLKRCEYWHPFKTMLDAGVKVGLGTDCPVDSINPVSTLHSAINRESNTLNECLDVQSTLKCLSYGNAYLSFQEDQSGTLEIGKYADFTVLSNDPFDMDSKDLGNLRAERTVVGGRIV